MNVVCARRVLAAAALLALVACGGGGAGGSGGGLQVALDRTSVNLGIIEGVTGTGTTQAVHASLQGGSGSYYLAVIIDKPDVIGVSFTLTGQTTATATFATSTPPAGVTTGNVTVQLCSDSTCHSIAWQKVIPYTVTTYSVATAPMVFDLAEGMVSPSMAVSVTPVDTAQALFAVQPIPTAWLSVVRDPASRFQVSVSTAGLRPGTYNAQVMVAPDGGWGTYVPVTLTVEAAAFVDPEIVVTLGLGATLTGTIPVSFRNGQSPAWSARSDRPWLGLTTASGTGAGAVHYAIDPAVLASIANWSEDAATIELDPTGLASVTTRLILRKRLPELLHASPAAVPVGTPATVHLFGRGLSQLGSSADLVASGAVTTVALPAASDAELVVTVTAAAAGRFGVSIPNPFSIATRSLELAATGPWTATKVARSGEVGHALVDPLRSAVFAIDTDAKAVVRYELDGVWQVSSIAVPSIQALGFSADLETLYVTAGDALYCSGTMWAFDPDTLQTGAASFTLPWGSCLIGGKNTIQATNDGRVWFSAGGTATLTYLDALTGRFESYSGPTVPYVTLSEPSFWAAPDGSRMMITQYPWAPSAFPYYLYASPGGVLSTPSIPQVYGGAQQSRDGGVVILDRLAVYAIDTWTLLGNATLASGVATDAQVSPDGSKVYVLVSDSSSFRVDVFDTGSVVGGTTDLVKLGEIAVTDQAADCGPSPAYGCNPYPGLLIGPRGDVLFLVGNQGLVVVPIPPSLAGPP